MAVAPPGVAVSGWGGGSRSVPSGRASADRIAGEHRGAYSVGRLPLILIVLPMLSCGDWGTGPASELNRAPGPAVTATVTGAGGSSSGQAVEVVPPRPGSVAGRIIVEEDPTLQPGYGFGPNPFRSIAVAGQWSPCERPCNEIAVAMGSDTVFTDRYGRFVFNNVDGGLEHRIHVVEALHPRKIADSAPSTFWHFFMFDTATVTTAWADTVEVVLDAREVAADITIYLGARPGAPWPQGFTDRIPGVTVTLFASDGRTVLERRTTDERGEVVFRPLERHVTYHTSPAGGYDTASYSCLDRKVAQVGGTVGWHVCADLKAPPWGSGSADRDGSPYKMVVPFRGSDPRARRP